MRVLDVKKMAALNAVVARQPDNPEAYHQRAKFFSHSGLHEKALADFKKTAALLPRSSGAQGNLADCLLTLGKNREALAAAGKAVELKGLPHDYVLRGDAHMALGSYEQAASDYGTALQCLPRNGTLAAKRARASFLAGLDSEARQDFEAALADASFVPDAQFYSDSGQALYNCGAYQEAARRFTVLMERFGSAAQAFFMRGMAYGKLGWLKEAYQDFTQAFKQDSSLIDALYNRCCAAALLARQPAGRAYAKQAQSDYARLKNTLKESAALQPLDDLLGPLSTR